MYLIRHLGNGCLGRKAEVAREGVHFEEVEREKGEERKEGMDDVKARGMTAQGSCTDCKLL